MTTFTSSFVYTLDANGKITNGHITALIANSAASSVEGVDDGIISVGETFTVTFSNPTTGATFDGTYTYVGHETTAAGVIGRDSSGNYFLFTNDGGMSIGQNLNTFIAENFPVCFLRGTMIACPDGERAVELIQAGDLILTRDGRQRPVKWVGHRQIDLTRHPDPDKARPIVIRAGALADGVPSRDLRVSPGHALLIGDFLVHAYRLVNETSILFDRDARNVEWFHIELDSHDILLADGAPAESFLDVGNRAMFENADGPVVLHPNMMPPADGHWTAGACAPFLLEQADVEPIWRQLMARAEQQGHGTWVAPETTDDPVLTLRVGGRDIHPVSRNGGVYSFVVPATYEPVSLVSRSAAPSTLRPWVADDRQLGVAISRISMRQGDTTQQLPLDHPGLTTGWWAVEQDGARTWRWTRGNASLPVMFRHPTMLTIETGPRAAYRISNPQAAAA